MGHKLKRADLRERVDQALTEMEIRRASERREIASDAYVYRRRRELPNMLDAARRKVAALENEARRYGLDDLVGQ